MLALAMHSTKAGNTKAGTRAVPPGAAADKHHGPFGIKDLFSATGGGGWVRGRPERAG